MDEALEKMIEAYSPHNNAERENAIKEIIQEIVLAGLSHGEFFNKAAFYGGTCLRIFHGLDRFSEDLDFALLDRNAQFQFDSYFPYIKKELLAYGIDMEVESKNLDNEIKSAFVKGNTKTLMMHFFPNNEESQKIIGNQKIKIKFEIDTDNPGGGKTEIKFKNLPDPYAVRIYNESTLFAGKIGAVLFREYKHRVKGRDFYDYLFYVSKKTKINLTYLENKLKNSRQIDEDVHLDINMVKEMLAERFKNVDYQSAKEDVQNFIYDKRGLELWNSELFLSTINDLESE